MRFLLYFLLFWSLPVAALDCAPRSLLQPNAPGTVKIEGSTPLGDWSNYWCPGANPPPGKVIWVPQPVAVLAKYRDPWRLALGTAQALGSADPLGVVNAALAASRVVPPAGTQDRFDWEALFQAACLALVAANQVPLDPLPPGYCPPPTPLPVVVPPAAPAYAVKPLGTAPDRPAYPVVGGVVGATSSARALRDQPCKNPVKASTGTDLWAEFGPAYAPNVVAVCSKR